MSPRRRAFLFTFSLTSLSLLQGCSTAAYLFQAGAGQFALFNQAKPLSEVLQNERVRPRTRELLSQVASMKKFGEESGLKATPNYVEYVDLHRSAAVYVVSASDPLKFEAKTWSFPIVGSFPYLGWFDLQNAKTFAQRLRDQEGWDVDVRGASAYSTLGWFRDAVLSSMIADGDEALGELANVILHESVHATLYLKGQSYFDESIASFVADRLTPEYLKRERGPESTELKTYVRAVEEGELRTKALHDAYMDLDRLYNSALPREEKLAKKAEMLEALRQKLSFKRPINNATLIQFKTYNTGVPEFGDLLKACGGDLKKFLVAVQSLKPESFSKPQQEELGVVLKPLIDRGCQGVRPL